MQLNHSKFSRSFNKITLCSVADAEEIISDTGKLFS